MKKFLRILFLLASLGVLFVLLDRVGWDKISEYVNRVSLIGICILVLCNTWRIMLEGIALKTLLLEDISLWYVHASNQSGAIINRFIPWEAGELIKISLISQKITSKSAISGVIVWNYLLKLARPISSMIAATTTWVFAKDDFSTLAPWIILASFLSFAPYVLFHIMVRIGIANTIVKLAKLIRLLRRDPQSIITKAQEIDRIVRSFSKEHPKVYYKAFVYQLSAQFLAWIILYLTLVFIHSEISFQSSGMLFASFSVMDYLVGILPSRIGTTEASGWLVFSLLQLEPSIGLMIQCLISLTTILSSGLSALSIFFFKIPKKNGINS